MSPFNRLKISTAVIAALAAGMVLLAGAANAKTNGTPAGSALKTAPVSTCWACRFVKRDSADKLDRKPVRDMRSHDKDHDRTHLADRKHKKTNAKDNLVCRGIAGCPMHTGSSNSGTPPATKPLPGAPAQPGSKPVGTTGATPVGYAKSIVGLSNGVATSRLASGPNGLTVSVNSPGAITLSNGTNSVTTPGTPGAGAPTTSTTTQY